jgi:radical SAM protein with 4Fe4S-binding SPASM domain
MLYRKNKLNLSHISFELTSICNLRCKYCYNIWKAPNSIHHQAFNSYRQARKTLKRLFRIADVDQIVFTGGEPLLAERFKELVLYARLKKKQVSIITNGNAGGREDYRQLKEIGVELFELPLHSPTPEIHDIMADTAGAWKKSTESFKELLELGARVVAVIVITRLNYRMVYETLKYLRSLGVSRVMLNRFNVGGQGIAYRSDLELSKSELNTAFAEASRAGKDCGIKLSSNVCTPLCIVNPKDYPNISFAFCSSDAAKRPLTLDMKGNLRFCNHSPVVLGNIFSHSLTDMLSSDEAQLWSKLIPDYCSDCDLYSRCMAGCRAASQQLGLGVNAPDPLLAV